MAKVEMSLQEYDSMKAELDAHKEIMRSLFESPAIYQWTLEAYKDKRYDQVTVETEYEIKNLSPKAQAIVVSHIKNLTDSLDIEGKFSLNESLKLQVGYYTRPDEEHEGE